MEHEANQLLFSQIVERGVGKLREIKAWHTDPSMNPVSSQCCQGFLFANCLETDCRSPHHISCLKFFVNFFMVWGSVGVQNVIMESAIPSCTIPTGQAVAFWCSCPINTQERSLKVSLKLEGNKIIQLDFQKLCWLLLKLPKKVTFRKSQWLDSAPWSDEDSTTSCNWPSWDLIPSCLICIWTFLIHFQLLL